MSRERMSTLLLWILVAVTGSWLSGCAKPPEEPKGAQAERPVEPAAAPAAGASQNAESAQPAATPTAEKPPKLPPKPNEVAEAVTRVFEKVATLDATVNPSFVVGDFNGDGSEDLAVAVKPNGEMLIEINSELANWILEDPRRVSIPGTGGAVRSTGIPVRAEKGDTLLAIIHGFGSNGWRNPAAKQTFLLKNGAGSDMRSQTTKDLQNRKDKEKLPPIRADIIRETIGGKSGLILWTGSKYAWYSSGL